MQTAIAGAISGAVRQSPSAGVTTYPLDDDMVVCDEQSGEIFLLNPTGAEIWALLDGSRTNRAVARAIAKKYHLDYHQAIQDVDSLVVELANAGLLRAN